MKQNKSKVMVNGIDIELGNYKIKGKAKKGQCLTSIDIDFTINGKPYQDVIGPCERMDIHIGPANEIITIDFTVLPKKQ